MALQKHTPKPSKQIGPEYTLRPRAVAVAVAGRARATVAVPKRKPVRSEEYRRLVAGLPCDCCLTENISQAAHPNSGKGMAMKADDRLCFPLCADQPERRGCHSLFDQHAAWGKTDRRIVEIEAGKRTRAEIKRRGLWPAGLAMWPGDE